MPELRWMVPEEMDGKLVRQAAMGGMGLSYGLFKRAKFHGRVELDGSYIGPRIVYTDTDLDVMLRTGPHTIETSRTGNLTVRWKNQWA